ncbi:MAG: hypothetical protein BWX93_01608 [Bacteroidetes bacterium ADurb.Bin139]|nr:MAG: hypothetical protein BWX93_01608 [Bacteroidetes bacterium ADurb.Bin139]
MILGHFLFPQGPCYLEVGKTLSFSYIQQLAFLFPPVSAIGIFWGTCFFKFFAGLNNLHELVQKPAVYPCQIVDLVYGVAGLHGFAYHKDAHVGRFMQRFVNILDHQLAVFHKTVHTLAYHAQSLLNGFFKSAPYGHHFAHRFHTAANFPGNAPEFAKVPARDLADHIIQGRFKISRSSSCY